MVLRWFGSLLVFVICVLGFVVCGCVCFGACGR